MFIHPITFSEKEKSSQEEDDNISEFVCSHTCFCTCLCVCVFVRPRHQIGNICSQGPIGPDEAARHWHALDVKSAPTGLVISQVHLGTPWGIRFVFLFFFSAFFSSPLPAPVTRHYQTAHSAPNAPPAHEDDHIWYTDDILSLAVTTRAHFFLFCSGIPPLRGCHSSQIYHFNGEVVRPEDYLRDKYIIVSSSGIDRVSPCRPPHLPNTSTPPTNSFKTNALRCRQTCTRRCTLSGEQQAVELFAGARMNCLT